MTRIRKTFVAHYNMNNRAPRKVTLLAKDQLIDMGHRSVSPAFRHWRRRRLQLTFSTLCGEKKFFVQVKNASQIWRRRFVRAPASAACVG
jgi:hypothetical protein